MAADDDLPEGSVASRVFEARNSPRTEAERAERRLADPPTPASDSPTARVLDRPGTSPVAIAAAVVCAMILHGGLLAVATATIATGEDDEKTDRASLDVQHVVELTPDEPAEKPPTPEPTDQPAPPEEPVEEPSAPPDEPPSEEPSGEPESSSSTSDLKPSDSEPSSTPEPSSEPAKPAAKAGDVVEATSDSPQVADFTDVEVPDGEADSFAGGVTASSGTSDRAVRGDDVQAGATADKTGKGDGNGGRAVGLDRRDWECPWPEAADDLSVDEQVVVLRAVVRPDGTPKSVSIVSDPGFGFGQAALECARTHQFRPALDDHGEPFTASSPPIRVRFTR